MEIEFSKKGEGKIFIGVGCRETKKGEYQKLLTLKAIEGINCNVGDSFVDSEHFKVLTTLVFNKEESIDVLIRNLQKLKDLNVQATLDTGKEVGNDPCCSCTLALGC